LQKYRFLPITCRIFFCKFVSFGIKTIGMKRILFFTMLCILSISITTDLLAQGVAINSSGVDADNSAMLDVKSTEKGMLIPRMTLSQRNLISNPATGLMIFQIDNTPGFYYYNGFSWNAMYSSDLDDGDWVVNGNDMYSGVSGNVGIGVSSSIGAKLHVGGSGTYDGIIRLVNSGAGGSDWSMVSTNSSWTAGTERLLFCYGTPSSNSSKIVFTGSGNVGIGTNSPTHKLHVNGDMRLVNGLYDYNGDVGGSGQVLTSTGSGVDWVDMNSYGYVSGSGTATSIAFWQDNSTLSSSNLLYWDHTNKRMGLGTNSPQSQLHITEDMQFGQDGLNANHTSSVWVENSYEGKIYFRETSTHAMGMRYNATDNKLYIDTYEASETPIEAITILRANGYVGILNTNPGVPLDVVGNAEINGILNMTSHKIEGVANPDSDDDAVNRGWVMANSSYLAGNQLSLTGSTFDVLEGAGSGLDADLLDGHHWSEVTGANGWIDDGAAIRLETSTDKVGIGITSPGAPLQVYKSATDLITRIDGDGGRLDIAMGATIGQSPQLRFSDIGNDLAWTIGANDYVDNAFIIVPGTTGNPIDIEVNQSVSAFSNAFGFYPDGKFYVSGNVGIGTTSPSTKLDVAGDIFSTNGIDHTIKAATELQNNTTMRGGIYENSGDGLYNASGSALAFTGWWHVINMHHQHNNGYNAQIAVPLSASPNEIFLRTSGGGTWSEWRKVLSENAAGNVGIGTTTPTSKLNVYGGSTRITGTSNTNADAGGMLIYDNTNGLGGGTAKKVERYSKLTMSSGDYEIYDDYAVTIYAYRSGSVYYIRLRPKAGHTGWWDYSEESGGDDVSCSSSTTTYTMSSDWGVSYTGGFEVVINRESNITYPTYVIRPHLHSSTSSGQSSIIVEAYYP
jgi:hypothetical protein